MSAKWRLADNSVTSANVYIWGTVDKAQFRPVMVGPLMTHSGHRPCIAAVVLKVVSAPFKVLG